MCCRYGESGTIISLFQVIQQDDDAYAAKCTSRAVLKTFVVKI